MDYAGLTQIAVLERLFGDPDPQTPDTIARHTGRTAEEVVAAIAALREAGCEFVDVPLRGTSLVASGIGCWVDYIEQRHMRRLGRRLVAYRTTTSTQDVARTLVGDASPPRHVGTVVTSDRQTAGRGRMGRRWFDADGGSLAFTAIGGIDGAVRDRLCLAACCAIADAVKQVANIDTTISWPNDLLVNGRKLAGILIERVGGYALLGVGVNVGPLGDTLPDDDDGRPVVATSLADEGVKVDRLVLLDAALINLHLTLTQATDTQLRRRWRARCGLLNERVTVDAAGSRLTGRIVDIDPQQGLLLEVERGPVVALPSATTSIVVD